MPLKFLYSKQKLKKSDLPRILFEFEESLSKWAENYSTDIEFTLNNFNDLSKIKIHFPDNLPIYFAKISCPPDSFSNESLFDFIKKNKRTSLRASFSGNEWPDCQMDLKIWNPHFLGFNYFNPLFIEETSSIRITPSGFSGSMGSCKELLKYLYTKLGDHFRLPPFEDCVAIGSASLPEDGVSVSMYTMGGMQISMPSQQNEILLQLFRHFLKLMRQPLNVSITLVDHYSNIVEVTNNVIFGSELKECGVDTVATGELGAISHLNLAHIQKVLKGLPKSTGVKVKLSNIKWRNFANHDTVSTLSFETERRSLFYWLEIYLYGFERESKSFKHFTSSLKQLTGLPFDKGRFWRVYGYEGNRYREEIIRIKRFYIDAYYFSQRIISDYKSRSDIKKFKTCDYYQAKPGIFTKSDNTIHFKDILIRFVSNKMSDYKYDAKSSSPQYGQVSFIRAGKDKLFNYVVYQRDPKWGSRIFRIEFHLSKEIMSNFSPGEGYSWRYEKSSHDFLGAMSWWFYNSEEELVAALENAAAFIREAGELFFNVIGDLMQNHLKTIKEKNEQDN